MQSSADQKQLGPVAKARTIFDLAREKPRRDAIQLAIQVAGVSPGTAATQYNKWKKTH